MEDFMTTATPFQQEVATFLSTCTAVIQAAKDKPQNGGLQYAAAYAKGGQKLCRDLHNEGCLADALRTQAAYILSNLGHWQGPEARKHKEELRKWVK